MRVILFILISFIGLNYQTFENCSAKYRNT